jgi:3-hydroxyacyl-[acyl-carrier-protein] dehydratase
VDNARFRTAVVPDCRLVVAAKVEKASRRLWRYQAQGWVGSNLAFEAQIMGVRLG